VLLVVAVVIAAGSIVFAVKPFRSAPDFAVISSTIEGNAVSGASPGGGLSSGLSAFSVSEGSCRAPVLDAWSGKRQLWAVTIDKKTPGLLEGSTVTVRTCRGEARHRLLLSVLGLLAAAILGDLLFIRRPRSGAEGLPDPT
jgi:hypothetical protein